MVEPGARPCVRARARECVCACACPEPGRVRKGTGARGVAGGARGRVGAWRGGRAAG